MTIEELYRLAKREGFENATILTESIDALISDYKWRFNIWFKAAICFSIFTVVVYVIASTASAIYAPDINLIQDLITRMKAN